MPVRRPQLLSLVWIVLCVALCQGCRLDPRDRRADLATDVRPTSHPEVEEVFDEQEQDLDEIVWNHDRVEAFLLEEQELDEEPGERLCFLIGHPVRSKPKVLGKKRARDLAWILLQRETYDMERTFADDVEEIPVIGFRFVQGARAVHVGFTAGCEGLGAHVEGGQSYQEAPLRARNDRLFRLIRSVFPKDERCRSYGKLEKELRKEQKQRLVELYGGEGSFRLLPKAATLEAFRIDPEDHATDGPERIAGYRSTWGVPVPRYLKRQLAKLLDDPLSYAWDSAKDCGFQPGIALRYRLSDQSLDLLFCLECDTLATYPNGSTEPRAMAEFDPMRRSLLPIFRDLFPQDPVVQALR